MFTGIINAVGKVLAVEEGSRERTLLVKTPYADAELGESIATSGVCLTVAEASTNGELRFYASSETCSRTNLGQLTAGSSVNLERALRLADRLSGHIVQGHVDGLAKLIAICPAGDSHELEVELPTSMLRYVIEKGSIALDGISLTVNSIQGTRIRLMIIPHTWAHTTLSTKKVGDDFNVELDMVAKYVERLTHFHGTHSGSD